MTFWHNQKYESIEKKALSGDFFRGLPDQKFPWLLKEDKDTDSSGDIWHIKIFCLGIEGKELTTKVKAKIGIEAKCQVANENIKKMNIQFQRLYDLNVTGWNILSEKHSYELNCLLEQLEDKSSQFLRMYSKKIEEKYTLEKKREIISQKIKNCKISNFS